jgi:hypothetical protein
LLVAERDLEAIRGTRRLSFILIFDFILWLWRRLRITFLLLCAGGLLRGSLSFGHGDGVQAVGKKTCVNVYDCVE